MKKSVIATVSTVAGIAIGAAASVATLGKFQMGSSKAGVAKQEKFKSYYHVLNRWLALKQEGKSITEYFSQKGYNKVAIYGMGEVGNRLYEECMNNQLNVAYAIDQNSIGVYSELDVYGIEDELPEVDVIVVTAIFAFDEIYSDLSSKVDCPIVSLEDIVFEI